MRTGEGDCAASHNSIRNQHSNSLHFYKYSLQKKSVDFRKIKHMWINVGSYSFSCHRTWQHQLVMHWGNV